MGNIVKLISPENYNVLHDVCIIEVDTSNGGVTTINFPKIDLSNLRQTCYISDISNNASNSNIIVSAFSTDLINNQSSINLSLDGIIAEIKVADSKRLIANLSTDDSGSTPIVVEDKNFPFAQTVLSSTWVVPHNLNKKCSVSITDEFNNKMVGAVTYTNNNQVIINFNSPKIGFVYCN